MIKLHATDAAAALGFSRYKTRDDVMRKMARIAHGLDSESTNDFAKQYFKNNIGMAWIDYLSQADHYCDKNSDYVSSKDYPWLTARPSGICHGLKTIEIRMPLGFRNKSRDELKFQPAFMQPDFYAHIQIGMLLTGLDKCDAYQWGAAGDFLEVIELDREWLSNNLPVLRIFYHTAIDDIDNPAHLEPKFPTIDTPQALALINEFEAIKNALDDLQARKDEIIEELAEIAQYGDAIIGGKKLSKIVRQGSVQYARALKENMPDFDLSSYTGKPTEYWKLT